MVSQRRFFDSLRTIVSTRILSKKVLTQCSDKIMADVCGEWIKKNNNYAKLINHQKT